MFVLPSCVAVLGRCGCFFRLYHRCHFRTHFFTTVKRDSHYYFYTNTLVHAGIPGIYPQKYTQYQVPGKNINMKIYRLLTKTIHTGCHHRDKNVLFCCTESYTWYMFCMLHTMLFTVDFFCHTVLISYMFCMLRCWRIYISSFTPPPPFKKHKK